MAKVNLDALKHLHLNSDVVMILKKSAEIALCYNRQGVTPEMVFLACFEIIPDLSDSLSRDILEQMLSRFNPSEKFAETFKSIYKNMAVDPICIKLIALRAGVMQSLNVRVTPETISSEYTGLWQQQDVSLASQTIQLLEGAYRVAKIEHGGISTQTVDVLRTILADTTSTPALDSTILPMLRTNRMVLNAVLLTSVKKAKEDPDSRQLAVVSGNTTSDDPKKRKKELRDLEDLGYSMNQLAEESPFSPVIGREAEITQMIIYSGRYDAPNVLLIGEPGTGKTAIVEEFVQRIVSQQIEAEHLKGIEIFAISVGTDAGTRYRGSFEERIKDLIAFSEEHPELYLFFDEIHALMGAGSASGVTATASEFFKEAIDRRRVRVIGSTTQAEYRKYIAPNQAFASRFSTITIKEPSGDLLFQIIEERKKRYEQYHNVTVTDDCIKTIMETVKSFPSGHSPRRELRILDGACASAKVGGITEVTSEIALETIATESGIPSDKLSTNAIDRLNLLQQKLEANIIGQNEAIESILSGLRRHSVGFSNRKKPILSLLLLGKSGVGKTEICRQLAEHYFPAPDDLLRFDMSEYMESHSVSRLIGSPPGYVGSSDGGLLVNKVREKPYCVVLFDEIEKAHPDIFNILLQVLEEGELTDSKGNVAYFNNTIVVLTSNVGSNSQGVASIGFGQSDPIAQTARNRAHYNDALKKQFRPELIGRLNDVIIFNELQFEDCCAIVELELQELSQRLREATNIGIEYDQTVIVQIASSAITDQYGARGLKTYIERHIENPLSEYILFGGAKSGDCVEFTTGDQPDQYLLNVMTPTSVEL